MTAVTIMVILRGIALTSPFMLTSMMQVMSDQTTDSIASSVLLHLPQSVMGGREICVSWLFAPLRPASVHVDKYRI